MVLFIGMCNSGRSQMAEAFFNHLTKGEGKAKSAGTRPAKRLDDNIIEIMWEAGIEISDQRPKQLTRKIIDSADKVIIMSCGVEKICPATFVETEKWSVEDLKDKPVEKLREIRDEIRARVIELLEEINPGSH